MNLRILTGTLFIIVSCTVFCQNTQLLNQTDNMGRKQGHWIKKYQNGNILYDGYFRDGHPAGEFKRYYETGILKSILVFSASGNEAEATNFYPDGLKASEGLYVNQLKEGKWKFFSSLNKECLISEEEYSKDKKNGFSLKYYPDSTIAEKINFRDDIKNGEWFRFHPNGSLHMKTTFRNGKLDGPFEAFFDDGKPEVKGQYRNDLKDGLWIVYKKDGNIKFRTAYLSGAAQNRMIDIYESNYIDSLEKNRLLIADPEKTGQIW